MVTAVAATSGCLFYFIIGIVRFYVGGPAVLLLTLGSEGTPPLTRPY